MFIYLPAASVLATLLIFRSVGIDYRAVAVGSLLPFFIDLFVGKQSVGHSFFLPCILLTLIMIFTIKAKRLTRRRLLCFVVGMFFALVFEGTFRYSTIWFWPIRSENLQHVSLLPSTLVMIVRDIIGLVLVWILTGLGELYTTEKFKTFISTGRIIFDTAHVEEEK